MPNVSLCVQENEVHYNPYVPPMNVITYQATEKLTETTTKPWPTSGFKTDAFSGSSGQRLTIKNHTFENGVGTIEFDGDIVSIDKFAFYGCTGLTNIEIPNGVTSIGGSAFADCSGLTSLTIPNSVIIIDGSAFYNTPWWDAYSADTSHHYGNIIYINDVAYKATATTISSCTFREGTIGIGSSAFVGCSGLTSITIPDGVTSIYGNSFNGCSGLTSVTIGSGVTSIGFQAFVGCSSLTSIVSNAMTAPTITDTTFQNVKAGGTLTVPSGSSGYDVWMGTGNYYLGLYNWTKVEQ